MGPSHITIEDFDVATEELRTAILNRFMRVLYCNSLYDHLSQIQSIGLASDFFFSIFSIIASMS